MKPPLKGGECHPFTHTNILLSTAELELTWQRWAAGHETHLATNKAIPAAFFWSFHIFSSPEPKAQNELLWSLPIPLCLSVHSHLWMTSLKPLGQISSNFMWSLMLKGHWKLVKIVTVHKSRLPPCPCPCIALLRLIYNGKPQKKSSSLKPWGPQLIIPRPKGYIIFVHSVSPFVCPSVLPSIPFYNQVLLRGFLITYICSYWSKTFHNWHGVAWKGSLPFYIYGPPSHAQGGARGQNLGHPNKVVCLFVLRFYGPVNPMGSCWVRSVYLTTPLLGRLSPLSG